MKISVITLLNVINYGSVLQTYATQEILKSNGYQVEFINYIRYNQTSKAALKRCFKAIPNRQLPRKLYNIFISFPISTIRARKVFKNFLVENIRLTPRQYYNLEELKSDVPMGDIYCTGSDQMWNSGWNEGIEKAFFLDFVDDKPKIAFSTSFGMTEIPKSEEEETIRLLKKYSFISVREQSAVALLKKYDIASQNVLDPTLMLDGDFWRKFAEHTTAKVNNQKYILVYQLHTEHGGLNLKNYVKKISEALNLPVKVIAYGVTWKRIFDEYIFMPTMQEFVALFANAEYVVTDSFHGTSFCINLNKDFTVIFPNEYSTRLQNILELNELENRVLHESGDLIYDKKIDYSVINVNMSKLRDYSLSIIGDGLKSVGC